MCAFAIAAPAGVVSIPMNMVPQHAAKEAVVGVKGTSHMEQGVEKDSLIRKEGESHTHSVKLAPAAWATEAGSVHGNERQLYDVDA